MKRALFLSTAILLASCSDLDGQLYRLEKFVSFAKVGSASDVWVVQKGITGQYNKVGLIFGFVDDYGFCKEIVELYLKRNPASQLSCNLAN
jgi:hypothetical protein